MSEIIPRTFLITAVKSVRSAARVSAMDKDDRLAEITLEDPSWDSEGEMVKVVLDGEIGAWGVIGARVQATFELVEDE